MSAWFQKQPRLPKKLLMEFGRSLKMEWRLKVSEKSRAEAHNEIPKKRGRRRLKELRIRGTKPKGLYLTQIDGERYRDQYGRVLEQGFGPDRRLDLRPIGLWDFGKQIIVRS
jgi:hypothetical protein